ncbi:MAG: flagellar export chaperone FliS, partial [Lachnospiraceae bacterium]|nr:flagellar export chaperone FliS [Lachnospiraceae bacterium]
MPAQNPYEQYQRNKVLTATPSEVTLMLYEGAIKFCNIAIMAIENNETEKAHINIMKTQRIIE